MPCCLCVTNPLTGCSKPHDPQPGVLHMQVQLVKCIPLQTNIKINVQLTVLLQSAQ